MNHYTYEIVFENKMKYIGVRSCKCAVEDDSKYLGSSKAIPTELYKTCEKVILKTFKTRIEAVEEEIRLHNLYEIDTNDNYYNQVRQSTTKFDCQGHTKKTHKYLELAARSKRLRRGEARTDLQKYADSKLRGKGIPNKRKGNKGMDNHKTKPWYYITDKYQYVEVYTSLIQYEKEFGETIFNGSKSIRQFLINNSHTPVTKGKVKGFTFGYLHTKPKMLTQENILLALAVMPHISEAKGLFRPEGPKDKRKLNRDPKTGRILKTAKD